MSTGPCWEGPVVDTSYSHFASQSPCWDPSMSTGPCWEGPVVGTSYRNLASRLVGIYQCLLAFVELGTCYSHLASRPVGIYQCLVAPVGKVLLQPFGKPLHSFHDSNTENTSSLPCNTLETLPEDAVQISCYE